MSACSQCQAEQLDTFRGDACPRCGAPWRPRSRPLSGFSPVVAGGGGPMSVFRAPTVPAAAVRPALSDEDRWDLPEQSPPPHDAAPEPYAPATVAPGTPMGADATEAPPSPPGLGLPGAAADLDGERAIRQTRSLGLEEVKARLADAGVTYGPRGGNGTAPPRAVPTEDARALAPPPGTRPLVRDDSVARRGPLATLPVEAHPALARKLSGGVPAAGVPAASLANPAPVRPEVREAHTQTFVGMAPVHPDDVLPPPTETVEDTRSWFLSQDVPSEQPPPSAPIPAAPTVLTSLAPPAESVPEPRPSLPSIELDAPTPPPAPPPPPSPSLAPPRAVPAPPDARPDADAQVARPSLAPRPPNPETSGRLRPVLASDILRAELAPREPGSERLRRTVALAGSLLVAATGLAEASDPAHIAAWAGPGVVALVAGVVPFRYGTRAVLALLVALPALALELLSVPALSRVGAALTAALLATLPAALFFRSDFRASRRARVFVGVGIALGLAWLVMPGAGAFLERSGGSWVAGHVPALALVPLLLLSALGFMGSNTTAGCRAWATSVVAWGALLAAHPLVERAVRQSAAAARSTGTQAVAVGALAAIVAVSLASVLAVHARPTEPRVLSR